MQHFSLAIIGSGSANNLVPRDPFPHDWVPAAVFTEPQIATVGAHSLGYQASLLIQPLVQAASTGLGVAEMARGQYWIHPALGEVVEVDTPRRVGLAVLALCLVQFVDVLGVTVVVTALPARAASWPAAS